MSATSVWGTPVGAGISNWATYYYNTDITPFTIQYLGDDPAADPEIYRKTSPMTYLKQVRTLTMIQHGENDRRVPIANAYELRQGLENRGVPVEMVVYKGFGHGVTKPKARRAVLEHNLQWFNHHLWGDPKPDFVNRRCRRSKRKKAGTRSVSPGDTGIEVEAPLAAGFLAPSAPQLPATISCIRFTPHSTAIRIIASPLAVVASLASWKNSSSCLAAAGVLIPSRGLAFS